MFTIAMLLFWFSDGPVDENLAEVCLFVCLFVCFFVCLFVCYHLFVFICTDVIIILFRSDPQMFKLFDEDGNGNISIQELLSMMAFFIEVKRSEFQKTRHSILTVT